MALREGQWRGHAQWVCDEHGFDTLKESTAAEHVAEFHAGEAAPAAASAAPAPAATTTAPAAPAEKKGK